MEWSVFTESELWAGLEPSWKGMCCAHLELEVPAPALDKPGTVAHACNHSTGEVERGGVRNSRLSSATKQDWGQSGIHETCLKKQKQNKTEFLVAPSLTYWTLTGTFHLPFDGFILEKIRQRTENESFSSPRLQIRLTSSLPICCQEHWLLFLHGIDVHGSWVEWGIQPFADGCVLCHQTRRTSGNECLYGPWHWDMTLFYSSLQRKWQRIPPSFIGPVFRRLHSLYIEMLWTGGLRIYI